MTPPSYRAYIFDLDGTLFRGDEALPHAVEVVEELRRRGAIVRFLTNNSSQTRSFYAGKLQAMGYRADPAEIYSSATGTASLLTAEGARSAFAVGMPGLVETLQESRIHVVNAGETGVVQPDGSPADVVVVGICWDFTYALLNGAMQQIRAGARFYGTNPDSTYPLEGGRVTPGAGSLVAAVRTASDTEPFIVGKPKPYLVELILREAGLDASETLVVGDRYDTDIVSGQQAGCDTHLVLTGITQTPPANQRWSDDLRGVL